MEKEQKTWDASVGTKEHENKKKECRGKNAHGRVRGDLGRRRGVPEKGAAWGKKTQCDPGTKAAQSGANSPPVPIRPPFPPLPPLPTPPLFSEPSSGSCVCSESCVSFSFVLCILAPSQEGLLFQVGVSGSGVLPELFVERRVLALERRPV